ncbi:MAG TPA: thrombospondin type 3 repeat-containing protein [Candidatus Paceibacterota bacterium]|jgi:hypothetical protein|nr:thrombospondin type 3 repeat-containing protein [Candidatus Paceibacterota bacterium]
MALSARTTRIIASSALSVVLIAGAYVISGPVPFLSSKFANAQSTDELLKAYAAKDSDSDGLPDWQEVLYGTDPSNPHSVSPTLTDSEAVAQGLVTPHTSSIQAVTNASTSTGATSADIPGPNPAPGSLTDQFGQEFFQDYINASNGGQQLTADQQQALITQLMTSYSQKASTILISRYTSISVRTSPSTSELVYAASIEQVFRSDDVPAGNSAEPIPLVQAFLENNDTSAQKKLVILGNSYANITKDLLQVPVPPELAAQHLALIQSFDTLAHATAAVNNYANDPLAVLGSLSLYVPTSRTIMATFQSMAQEIIANNGEPAAGTPGALIVQVARSAQSQ